MLVQVTYGKPPVLIKLLRQGARLPLMLGSIDAMAQGDTDHA